MLSPHPGPCFAIVCLALATPLAAAPEAARPVTVTRPVREPLVTTWELTGSITARRQSRLSARTSGLIHKLQVDAGDTVAQGDVLMDLDPALAALALERAVAARRQAELELAEAERLVTEGRNLAKVGGFSRSEAETRETNVRVRRALLESLTVQVREQEETIARHRLPAPFAGVISRKLAEEGEWVQTGTPVLELVETGSPWLDVQAPQEAYAALHDGGTGENPARLEVAVQLDAFPDASLPGTIVARVPVKDMVARTFLVRLELEDPQGLAAPGMSARARFSLRSQDPVLQVARDAVVRLPDGTAKVWLVESEGGAQVARSRVIEPGRALTTRIEVRRGLEGSPLLVLRGNENLREGQTVTILAAPADPPAPSPAE
jgi:RND family efflux transporter MFP subunit